MKVQMILRNQQANVNTMELDVESNFFPSDISVYITMPDGVDIAADIWLPKELASGGEPVPVLVEFTRYWRVAEGKSPRDRVLYFPEMGFAHAVVDGRGSGASFGFRQAEQSVTETDDFQHVINWLADQSWCNGSVISIGSSYSGNTAEIAMKDAPIALKASIPRFTDFDFYAHLFFPGGLQNKGFLKPWGEGVFALDMNQVGDDLHTAWKDYSYASVKPVGNDKDKVFLGRAITDHKKNIPLYIKLAGAECRDDFSMINGIDDVTEQWVSGHLVQENYRLQEIPSYHWASFNDAGTAAGVIARFLGNQAPMRVVIGWWSHGAQLDTNPFCEINSEASPGFKDQFTHIAAYLSELKTLACQQKRLGERAIYYFTAGQNIWQKTNSWPPLGISIKRWYLSSNNTLTDYQAQVEQGKDQYLVNFNARTGTHNRWNQMVPEVNYGDRAEADGQLLCYTSKPLSKGVEITGTPVIYLTMASTHTDGAVIAYLEVVGPDGKVTMLTEGGLRLIHRKVSLEAPSYPVFGPLHSFERKDLTPMPIDTPVEVGFEMLPLSVTLKKGDTLRVAVAGHDEDAFTRVPSVGNPMYTICRNAMNLSYLDLPMRLIAEASFGQNENPFFMES